MSVTGDKTVLEGHFFNQILLTREQCLNFIQMVCDLFRNQLNTRCQETATSYKYYRNAG